MFPIYLDYNATTHIDPLVVEIMLPYINESYCLTSQRATIVKIVDARNTQTI